MRELSVPPQDTTTVVLAGFDLTALRYTVFIELHGLQSGFERAPLHFVQFKNISKKLIALSNISYFTYTYCIEIGQVNPELDP